MISEQPAFKGPSQRLGLDIKFADRVISCLESQEGVLNFGNIVGVFSPMIVNQGGELMLLRSAWLFRLSITLMVGDSDSRARDFLTFLNQHCKAEFLPQDHTRRNNDTGNTGMMWSFGNGYSSVQSFFYPAVKSEHPQLRDKPALIEIDFK